MKNLLIKININNLKYSFFSFLPATLQINEFRDRTHSFYMDRLLGRILPIMSQVILLLIEKYESLNCINKFDCSRNLIVTDERDTPKTFNLPTSTTSSTIGGTFQNEKPSLFSLTDSSYFQTVWNRFVTNFTTYFVVSKLIPFNLFEPSIYIPKLATVMKHITDIVDVISTDEFVRSNTAMFNK